MDFKKIARIFIIAFTLLNVYLLIGILERQDIQDISIQTSSNGDIIDDMEQLNIDVPDLSEVDVENAEVYSIQIDTNNILEDTIDESDVTTGTLNDDGKTYYVSFHSNPFELEGNPEEGFTENDISNIQSFINSDQVLFGEEYRYGRYDPADRQFVFYHVIDGLPITDGTSEISLFVNDEGEIYAYEQTYAGPGQRQGTPLQLISANRAIEILFLNNEIRSGSEIEVPLLAYQRGLHLEDLSMYSPIWIVEVIHSSERNTFRVDAVNGTIIRQPVLTPGEENGPETETDSEDTEDATDSETEAGNGEETDSNSNAE